jgi:hypothetical protein
LLLCSSTEDELCPSKTPEERGRDISEDEESSESELFTGGKSGLSVLEQENVNAIASTMLAMSRKILPLFMRTSRC